MQSYTPLMALQKRELDRQNITQIAVRSGKGEKTKRKTATNNQYSPTKNVCSC